MIKTGFLVASLLLTGSMVALAQPVGMNFPADPYSASSPLSRSAKTDDRAITVSPCNSPSVLMSSSVSPSAKYALSLSELSLMKGITAIDDAVWVCAPDEGRPATRAALEARRRVYPMYPPITSRIATTI